ncbi:hypothetical protein L228DRAFT_280104 [Xylona heveae TC161]|uniref:Uncharacterized protein n=1 Tax=Xylona heveae (strain CBS 132557 / TC161) TaxID=1328760 RepID=A0A161UB54_XYLHT|nr:hypothetical protein L228DRAFT_280104 [Xylona heveae TC161]KZF26965.1 hypothetical protein L228DRAFT_280104 [Xylona heveae TC161]
MKSKNARFSQISGADSTRWINAALTIKKSDLSEINIDATLENDLHKASEYKNKRNAAAHVSSGAFGRALCSNFGRKHALPKWRTMFRYTYEDTPEKLAEKELQKLARGE